MNIPRPGPGEALVIADGRVMIISRADLERLKRGDAPNQDEPIASMRVSAANFDEAIARVQALFKTNAG